MDERRGSELRTTVRFVPGPAVAVVGPQVIGLVADDPRSTLVKRLYSAVAKGVDIDDLLEMLAGVGLSRLPSFGLVSVEQVGVRVLVRGEVVAALEPPGNEGARTIAASGVRTWVEHMEAETVSVQLLLADDLSELGAFEIAAGLVPACRVEVVTARRSLAAADPFATSVDAGAAQPSPRLPSIDELPAVDDVPALDVLPGAGRLPVEDPSPSEVLGAVEVGARVDPIDLAAPDLDARSGSESEPLHDDAPALGVVAAEGGSPDVSWSPPELSPVSGSAHDEEFDAGDSFDEGADAEGVDAEGMGAEGADAEDVGAGDEGEVVEPVEHSGVDSAGADAESTDADRPGVDDDGVAVGVGSDGDANDGREADPEGAPSSAARDSNDTLISPFDDELDEEHSGRPDAEPGTGSDGEADYDHLFGATQFRTVEDAAVRTSEENDADDADLAGGAPLISAIPGGPPPTPPPAPGARAVGTDADGDHDGRTISLADLRGVRQQQSVGGAPAGNTAPMVHAISCDSGHLNPTHATECRVCGSVLEDQVHVTVPRPVLGVLRFSDGREVEVARPMLLGRAPRAEASIGGDLPQLVTVPSPLKEVSGTHLELRLEGWQLLAVDRQSTNGTVITLPGRDPQRLRPGEPFPLTIGTAVNLADEAEFVFEAPA